jgi:hypothetical protein
VLFKELINRLEKAVNTFEGKTGSQDSDEGTVDIFAVCFF